MAPAWPLALTNHGTVSTSAIHLSLMNQDKDRFGIPADQCTGQILQPNQSCTVAVALQAMTNGSYQSSLVASDGTLAATAALTGTADGFQPALTWTGGGDMTITGASPSPAVVYTLNNVGGGPTGTLQPVNTNATPGGGTFQIANGTDSCSGQILVQQSSCTVSVRMLSTLNGTFSNSMLATDGTVQGSATLSGSASGLAPVFGWTGTASTLNITGGVSPGPASTLTLTNSGTGTSTAVALTIGGTQKADFQIASGTDTCTGQTLAPAQSCTVGIQPVAVTNLSYSATLTAAEQSVTGIETLQGAATGFSPKLVWASTSPPAATLVAAGAAVPQSLTLTNQGSYISNPIALAIAGTSPASFTVSSDTCTGATLAIGASCTVSFGLVDSGHVNGGFGATLTGGAANDPVTLTGTISGYSYALTYGSYGACSATSACQGIGSETRSVSGCTSSPGGAIVAASYCSSLSDPSPSIACNSPAGAASCGVANGTGSQSCAAGATSGTCLATACASGFHASSDNTACIADTYVWQGGGFDSCGGGSASYVFSGSYGACSGGSGSWSYSAYSSCSASSVCSGGGTESRSGTCNVTANSGTKSQSGTCTWTSGSGTATQSVTCLDSSTGQTVANGLCTGTPPASSQSCTPTGTPSCTGSSTASAACTPTSSSVCGAEASLTIACSSPSGSRSCSVANGSGSQTCAAGATSYGSCAASSCNSGYYLSGSSCAAYSYSASGATYGACSTSCGSGSAPLSSWSCIASPGGASVSTANCSAPASTQACSSTSGCTYSPAGVSYGACSASCGSGTQSPTSWSCTRSDGTGGFSSSYCSPGAIACTGTNCAVNGACGSYAGQCASGSANVSLTEKCFENWTCVGSGGGSTASCEYDFNIQGCH